MDQITRTLLTQFMNQNSLQMMEEDKAFEHFCGYLVTAAHYGDSFETDSISVGAGGDCGIDCLAVIVNGTLVTEPEEVDDLAERNGYVDATFIFVQADRSSNFETAKIGQVVYGVRDFFSDQPRQQQNDRIKHYSRIWKKLLDQCKLFKKGNPQCLLYYVTTGKWTDDANLVSRRDAGQKDVEDLGLFRKVVFNCLGAEHIHRLYQESQNAVSAEITFSYKVALPEIPGVEQAYLGLLPATEFLKLVENSSGDIRSTVFYDNIRHWQDWNPVNTEMRETLSGHKKMQFPLLNNGATVVASRLLATGNRLQVEDYQIANGCQTSFVLHECRNCLDSNVMVPVRIIATSDDGIKSAIIKATNRQTAVTREDLWAITEFPKRLERYFPTFDGAKRLYYERRSRQYAADADIERVRVIDMTILVRTFAAMFLQLPHRTTRNYKALLDEVGTRIFGEDHQLEPYYVAAFAYYRLEYFFRNQTIAAHMKPARYQLLLAFRLICDRQSLPPMNSNEMKRYCDSITSNLWDDQKCKEIFLNATERIKKVAGDNMNRDFIRTETFTKALLEELAPS